MQHYVIFIGTLVHQYLISLHAMIDNWAIYTTGYRHLSGSAHRGSQIASFTARNSHTSAMCSTNNRNNCPPSRHHTRTELHHVTTAHRGQTTLYQINHRTKAPGLRIYTDNQRLAINPQLVLSYTLLERQVKTTMTQHSTPSTISKVA